MKFYSYLKYVIASVGIISFTGCNNNNIDEEHHYDNKAYISTEAVMDDLLIKEDITSSSRSISYRLGAPAAQKVQLEFAAVPSMTATYNLIYKDNASALDKKYYEIPETVATIEAGSVTSTDVVVNFKNTNELDKERKYVLPVSIVHSNIEVLESKKTVYFVFKGASLINVVADIRDTFFEVKWKSDVKRMTAITVEALVRSSNWKDGRSNPLSTIFGIEGADKFMIRVGDVGIPFNQLQVVAPGGKFPERGAIEVLPTNEWVHIAVVYDPTFNHRIIYINGKRVYRDNRTEGNLDMTRFCYIGKAKSETEEFSDRYLPGEISELRVWNVHRSAQDIADHMYQVDPTSYGLVAYWKFNEGNGATIKDHTGHGNDLTAQVAPRWVHVELPEKKK